MILKLLSPKRMLTLGIAGLFLVNTHAQELASADKRDYQQSMQTSAPKNKKLKTLDKVLLELEDHFKVFLNYEVNMVKGKNVSAAHKISDYKTLDEALIKLLSPIKLKFEKVRENFYVIYPEDDRPYLNKIDNRNLENISVVNTSSVSVDSGTIVALNEQLNKTIIKLSEELMIKGKVTSETGEGLPGVNIVIKGTTTGTTSDVSGDYSIMTSENATLVFSYVGYIAQEIIVNSRNAVNPVHVKLNPEVSVLEEVIVVGYGTQKRSDVTGSVSSVPKSRLQNLPVTNILHALEGSVAGVNISQTSTVPGSSANIQVRGLRSISSDVNNSPYIILDGVPFQGGFNDINSNDIESMEILKDASAVAIYGTRGSNGVILITTKRGKTGKPTVKYSTYAGPEYMSQVPRPMEGAQYAQKYKDFKAQRGEKYDTLANYTELPNYRAGRETDWIKESSQQGFIQDHNVSISGGTKDVNYFISGDFLNQNGVLKGYKYQRISLRSNLDVNVNSWLTMGTSLFFVHNDDGGGRVSFANVMAMSPYGQPYEANGDYKIFPMYPETLYTNPLSNLTAERLNQSKNLTSTFYAEIKPSFVKGLKYRLNGTYAYLPEMANGYTGRGLNDQLGTASIDNVLSTNWTIENILTYNKDFNKHHIDVTALYSAQENNRFTSGMRANTFINDQLDYSNIGAAGKFVGESSFSSRRSLLSQMLRVNYSFAGKYLLTLTARRDGSSVFGDSTNKYAVFPSMAVGWNIANEGFMKNITPLNTLKLRASYGNSGNEGIPPYGTITTQALAQYIYSGTTANGVKASNIGNPYLKWETTTSLNLGLDFGLFGNRVTGTFEVYDSKTRDLLLTRQIPLMSGYSSIRDNIGKTQNKGIEITLNTVNVIAGGFSWESSLNVAANQSKILALYGDSKDDVGNKWFIGKPLNAIYDYKMVGVWQTGEDPAEWDKGAKPGDLKFADINGDKIINSLDRVYQGTSLPDYTGGITNTFKYKDLSLRVFIQTFQGAKKNNPLLNRGDFGGRINQPAAIGYWTEGNQNNSRPSLSYTNSRGYGYPSDYSYTRIKDISLSYNVPSSLLDHYKIAGLMLYLSARNVYTFTNWIGLDPEQNWDPATNAGINKNNYPNVGTYVLGLNISLQ